MGERAPRTSAIGVLRHVVGSYLARPWLFGAVVLAMAYQVAFALFLTLVAQYIFDDVVLRHDHAALRPVVIVVAGALLMRGLAAVVQEHAMSSLAASAMVQRRALMFENLQRKEPSYFSSALASDILAQFSSSLVSVEGATTRLAPRTIYSVLTLAASMGLAVELDVRLAGIACIALVVAFLAPRRLGARASALGTRRRESEASLLAAVQESIQLQSVVRTYGAEGWMRAGYRDRLARFHGDVRRSMLASSRVETLSGITVTIVQGAVLCVAAWLALRDDLTPGEFAAYTGLIAQVATSAFHLSALIPSLIETAGELEDLEALLAPPAAPTDERALPPLAKAIELDHVTFSYTGQRNEVTDVSLEVPAGSTTAFVGPSGSGKSTVLSLITRANQPRAGRVLLDGVDIAHARPESLYAQMAVVAQESLLFNASVRDNLRVGKPDATDAELEAAARQAEIHETILAMPRGYDSIVGERGGSLSGGQRQRLAIARALLRDPRLLVLDEATSALDPATEVAVSKTLAELGKGRTTVSVTHRLSTITDYERIHVLRDGVLVESGRHAELVELGGLYRTLWDKQRSVSVEPHGQATLQPALLAMIPLFAALDETTRDQLASQFITLHVGADHELFRAGDPGDMFYVIARGRVRIEVPGRGDAPARERLLGDGDSFGEIALLEDIARTASARATVPTVLLALPRQRFLDAIARVPGLAAKLREKASAHLADDDRAIGS